MFTQLIVQNSLLRTNNLFRSTAQFFERLKFLIGEKAMNHWHKDEWKNYTLKNKLVSLIFVLIFINLKQPQTQTFVTPPMLGQIKKVTNKRNWRRSFSSRRSFLSTCHSWKKSWSILTLLGKFYFNTCNISCRRKDEHWVRWTKEHITVS